MPLKDPEKQRQYVREYYEKNKEKIKAYRQTEKIKEYYKQYREKNKEKLKQDKKDWNENNKKKVKDYNQIFMQTETGIKLNRINNWKQMGVNCDDFDNLYEIYINTTHCQECNVELIGGSKASNRKCLDHSHETGEFRNILCHTCNVRRGK
jgi:lysyl-tRNA synthetase class II